MVRMGSRLLGPMRLSAAADTGVSRRPVASAPQGVDFCVSHGIRYPCGCALHECLPNIRSGFGLAPVVDFNR